MSEPPIRPSRSRLWREHTMHTRSGKITTRRAHYKNLTNIQPLVPGNISPDEFKGKMAMTYGGTKYLPDLQLVSDAPIEAVKGIGPKTAEEMHNRNIHTAKDLHKYLESLDEYERQIDRRQQAWIRQINMIEESMEYVKKDPNLSKDYKKEVFNINNQNIEENITRLKHPFVNFDYPEYELYDDKLELLKKKKFPIRIGHEWEDLFWQFPEHMIEDLNVTYLTKEQMEARPGYFGIGTVGAFYDPNRETIAIKEGEYDKRLVFHEFGHHIHDSKMNKHMKNRFKRLSFKLSKVGLQTYSPYDKHRNDIPPRVQQTEWFADVFAQYSSDKFKLIKSMLRNDMMLQGVLIQDTIASQEEMLRVGREDGRTDYQIKRSYPYQNQRRYEKDGRMELDKLQKQSLVLYDTTTFFQDLMRPKKVKSDKNDKD